MRKKIIYDLLNKNSIIFLIGCILGLVTFIFIYGFDILNFTNYQWILENNSDLTQHYLGWEFYRKSSFGFPIGLIDNVMYPEKLSIIYMDIIPLFAVIFRLFSFALPENFQYLGLFGLICFCFQGGFSAITIKKLTSNFIASIFGSVFFLISTVFLIRMFNHTALAAHAVILACIYVFISEKNFNKTSKAAVLWSILMAVASSVHIYFIPIVAIFMLFFVIRDFIENKNFMRIFIIILSTILTGLLVLYVLGAFYTKVKFAAGGLGLHSSNLNTFFNSMGDSVFLKSLKIAVDTQYEGQGYLGLGMIILTFISLILLFIGNKIKFIIKDNENTKKESIMTRFIYLFLFIAFFLLALSPVITFADKQLFVIMYPNSIVQLLSIFRASGRFIWPAMYLIMFWSIYEVFKVLKKYLAISVIIVCVCIQYIDLSKFIMDINNRFNTPVKYESLLKSEAWTDISDKINEIVFITGEKNTVNSLISDIYGNKVVFDLGNYALKNNLSLNDFYLARRNLNSINTYRLENLNKIFSNEAPEKILYIFPNLPAGILGKNLLNLYEID